MRFEIEVSNEWIIPKNNFDKSEIEIRLSKATEKDRGFLRSAFNFLYGEIKYLKRERLKVAERYLTKAEIVVIRWLVTRSGGSGKKEYGADCVSAARKAWYRCSNCDCPDVRTLNIDHVNGRGGQSNGKFKCLCANCHSIKSREKDWTGQKRLPTS